MKTRQELQSNIFCQVSKVERPEITRIARLALGSRSAEPAEWHVEVVSGGMGPVTGGVYRVAGRALESEQDVRWSAIVKVVSLRSVGAQASFLDPNHALYWKREALAYTSGLLNDLPGGITAPRCYDVVEVDEHTTWLWLEDVRDAGTGIWFLEEYAHAARCLGRFNGAYMEHLSTPPHPWLVITGSPRGLLNGNTELRTLAASAETWRQPLLRSAFPVPVAERVLRLWDERETLLRALDRVRTTFCHLDAWRGNMRMGPSKGGGGSLILLDWAFPGMAAAGTDAGDLFAPSFNLLEVGDTPPGIFDQAIFESYVDGLRDAGWRGDTRAVRFAFAAFSALKYGCFMPWLGDVCDPARQATWERLFGRPFPDFAHRQAELLYYLLDLADEARLLAS